MFPALGLKQKGLKSKEPLAIFVKLRQTLIVQLKTLSLHSKPFLNIVQASLWVLAICLKPESDLIHVFPVMIITNLDYTNNSLMVPHIYFTHPIQISISSIMVHAYSKNCLQRPLKKNTKIGFQDRLSLDAGQKYCRMLQGKHSAILSTFIKLPFVIKICVLSIFEWPLKTGFTV